MCESGLRTKSMQSSRSRAAFFVPEIQHSQGLPLCQLNLIPSASIWPLSDECDSLELVPAFKTVIAVT